MRVLSRKVALRARESPSRYPSPAKVPPCQKGGAQSGVGIPFPRDHSRRASFSSLSGRTVCARGPVWDRPLRKDRRASGYAVGAALAAARKPSPLKGEGGWPKARRMRVLSRKVALRARESPSRYPSPAKAPPCQKGGAQSGVGIPSPRDHSRRAPFFSVWAAHLGRPPFPCAGRRNSYRPASAPSLIPSTNPRRKDSRSLSSPASS